MSTNVTPGSSKPGAPATTKSFAQRLIRYGEKSHLLFRLDEVKTDGGIQESKAQDSKGAKYIAVRSESFKNDNYAKFVEELAIRLVILSSAKLSGSVATMTHDVLCEQARKTKFYDAAMKTLHYPGNDDKGIPSGFYFNLAPLVKVFAIHHTDAKGNLVPMKPDVLHNSSFSFIPVIMAHSVRNATGKDSLRYFVTELLVTDVPQRRGAKSLLSGFAASIIARKSKEELEAAKEQMLAFEAAAKEGGHVEKESSDGDKDDDDIAAFASAQSDPEKKVEDSPKGVLTTSTSLNTASSILASVKPPTFRMPILPRS